MRTVIKTGIKGKKTLIISVAAVIVCICIIALAIAASASPTVVFLDREYDGKSDLIQFTQNAADSYFKDKSITLKYNGAQKEIPAQDIVSTDIDKTVEKISNELTGRSFLKKSRITVLPVLINNMDALKTAVSDLVEETETSADFYTVSEDLKTVSFDFENKKTVPDIDGTVKYIFEQTAELNFAQCDIKYVENVTEQYADYICSLVDKKPTDATLSVENGVEKITPEKTGYTISKDELSAHLSAGEKIFTVSISEILKPEVTAETLEGKELYGDVLSTLSSRYNTGDVNRSKNIALAASKINGYVLQPGDVFSYNAVVGPRTYANGFKDAGVYTANGVESGVGGGICQVSSTLYGAQLMANLKTVTRTNHSYTVSYLPSGQDATVSYGSIDYKFKNSLEFPVKIECTASGGVLTVKFLGIKTDNYREIKLYNEIVATSAPNVIEKTNASLEPGQQKVIQNGQNGMTVNTYKIYYKNGAEEKREFVHKSVYIPMPRIIETGAEAEQIEQQPEQQLEQQPEQQPEQPEQQQPIEETIGENEVQDSDNEKQQEEIIQNLTENTENTGE